eukprot:CAMPEP_0168521814 /NCGR_PEP_ID=MMETSP0405-20121227/8903_1 /TAXON_ID=498012 /ORGANISM="Trichosphaerium sp, Strain Am-I-7 wt" /LENGTH=96 /DNA_ID=CAMNT_0008543151 /DNA_START=230 /DNA_END=517 /DNA_ORIENTATION=+
MKNEGKITLCLEYLSTDDDVSHAIDHEVSHIYDMSVLNITMDNCRNVVLTEMKACKLVDCSHVDDSYKLECTSKCIKDSLNGACLGTQQDLPQLLS